MFVRFRSTARRLQASLVETRRVDGKVKHEHVAALGSVPSQPSRADRIAFWTGLHPKLARLSNRFSVEVYGSLLAALHARIPMPTPDDQQTNRHEMAREDARQQTWLAEATAAQLAEQKAMLEVVQRNI